MTSLPTHHQALTFTPLYQQVRESILQRVTSGEWLPGKYLPSETTLAQQYNVSQGTLRKALNALTREKILVRFQGKGTAVAVLCEDSAMFRFFTLVDEHNQRVLPTSKVHKAVISTANPEEYAALNLKPGSKVIRIERVRFLEQWPVINEYISLSAVSFPHFDLNCDTIVNALYEFYEREYNITIAHADEQISAVPARGADVERLHTRPDSPLLCVKRIAYDLKDNPIEYRVSFVETEKYKYFFLLR